LKREGREQDYTFLSSKGQFLLSKSPCPEVIPSKHVQPSLPLLGVVSICGGGEGRGLEYHRIIFTTGGRTVSSIGRGEKNEPFSLKKEREKKWDGSVGNFETVLLTEKREKSHLSRNKKKGSCHRWKERRKSGTLLRKRS